MEINQKQFLRALYERKTINIYAWHQETCMSPVSIASVVLSLRKNGLLQLSDNLEDASLTEYGRKWVVIHSKELFATKSEEPWKNVPEEMSFDDDLFSHSLFEVADLQKLLDNLEE